MLQKTFVKSLFQILIKTFMIEAMKMKTFWLESLLQEALSNWLWTCIFHVHPHSMARLAFIEKKRKIFLKKKLESPLILFIFFKEKQNKK